MPYQESPFFNTPHPTDSSVCSVPLYKYMTKDKFIWMLQEGSLYFPNVYSFRDKDEYEGSLTDLSKKEAKKLLLLEQKTLIEHDDSNDEFLRQKRAILGVSPLADEFSISVLQDQHSFDALLRNFSNHLMFCNCWFQKDTTSPSMWAEYGDKSPTSIAIGTNVEELKQSFKRTDYNIHIGDVEYTDYVDIGDVEYMDYVGKHIDGYENISSKDLTDHDTVLDLFYAPIMHKSRMYDDEHEVRAVISFESICKKHLDRVYTSQIPFYTDRLFEEFSIFNMNKTNKMKNIKDLSGGIKIKVDLQKLIKVVLTSPNANEFFKDPLRKLLKKYNINVPVF